VSGKQSTVIDSEELLFEGWIYTMSGAQQPFSGSWRLNYNIRVVGDECAVSRSQERRFFKQKSV